MSDSNYDQLPLGKATAFVSDYSPDILCPIGRQRNRDQLGLAAVLPFTGVDLWTGYELSWLNSRGKPEVACAEFNIPCESPAIIESKSFKLYLNSLNLRRFDSADAVAALLQQDLSAKTQSHVGVNLLTPEQWLNRVDGKAGGQIADGKYRNSHCLDNIDIDISEYHPAPDHLKVTAEECEERLHSHLLRSLCPVTGQPDWGSLFVYYRGAAIDHAGLLRYIVSYREHQDFHEHCVEQIFCDIWQRCNPQELTVYARYLRRGGLDINPYRWSGNAVAPTIREYRQ